MARNSTRNRAGLRDAIRSTLADSGQELPKAVVPPAPSPMAALIEEMKANHMATEQHFYETGPTPWVVTDEAYSLIADRIIRNAPSYLNRLDRGKAYR